MKRAPLAALTGLRAVLALQVLAYHAFFTFGRTGVLLQPGPAKTLVAAGYLGVNAFFVLSGFVLAYAHVGDDGAMATGVRPFYRARFARIYPMHIIGVALALPLFVLQSQHAGAPAGAIAQEGLLETLVCGSLLQAFFPRFVFALNGPAWSLSVEAVFYLAFPLVARALARLSRRGLFVALAASWGLALLPAILRGAHAPPVEHATPLDLFVRFDPLVRLPELVLGFVLGRLFVSFSRAGRAHWKWDLRLLVALFALVFGLARSNTLPEPLLHAGLLDPLWVALFVCAARSELAEATFGSRAFVLFGQASFALYVVHKPLWFWMERLAPRDLPRLSFVFVAVYAAIALVVSALLFRLVEEPLRRLLTRARPSPRPSPSRA
jgi:peptidoglycan/LPS O-acetylase OafA/YrhL